MVEFGDVAEVLGGLENVTRLVVVAAHAHRAVVAVGTRYALREVLAAHRTDAFRFGRFVPYPLQVVFIAAAEIHACKCRTRIVVSRRVETHTRNARPTHLLLRPFLVRLQLLLLGRIEILVVDR